MLGGAGYVDCETHNNRIGGDLKGSPYLSVDETACAQLCTVDPSCQLFVLSVYDQCYLKTLAGSDGFNGPDDTIVQSCIKGTSPTVRTDSNSVPVCAHHARTY